LAAQHEDELCAGNLAASISVYAAFRRDKLRWAGEANGVDLILTAQSALAKWKPMAELSGEILSPRRGFWPASAQSASSAAVCHN
jgi:hypothetical protein